MDVYFNVKKIMAVLLACLMAAALVFTGCTDGGDEGDDSGLSAGNTLKDKLDWIRANAQSGGSYTITIDRDETLDDAEAIVFDADGSLSSNSNTLDYNGKTNITIQLNGGGHKVSFSSPYGFNIFRINSGVTLILEQITLQGRVSVRDGGTLEMRAGTKITGSSNGTQGGGVGNGGTFIMNGGEISGNKAGSGGGVFNSGRFTMNAGEISGNTVVSDSLAGAAGGGVYNYGSASSFTMNGGKISGNTVSASYSGNGGGVDVHMGSFTMNGGEISGNKAGFGGGVNVRSGTFTMTGGEITGNTATSSGGGVNADSGTFKKQGGTITGYASDERNGNVVKNASGVVQSNSGHAGFMRGRYVETTVGPDVVW